MLNVWLVKDSVEQFTDTNLSVQCSKFVSCMLTLTSVLHITQKNYMLKLKSNISRSVCTYVLSYVTYIYFLNSTSLLLNEIFFHEGCISGTLLVLNYVILRGYQCKYNIYWHQAPFHPTVSSTRLRGPMFTFQNLIIPFIS